jgi:patatin-like phospholipase/acyl hydrolase
MKATGAEKPTKKIRSKGAGPERAEIEQTEVEIDQSTGKSAWEVGPMTKGTGTGAHLTIEVKDEEADRHVGAISEEADHMTIEVENVKRLRGEAGSAKRLWRMRRLLK